MLDEKIMVPLGGLPQRVHIRSLDPAKPVLLFLHGGPGVCNRHTIMTDHRDLLDTFTVVCWDQRGSGGSYYGVRDEDLTISRFVEDARELIEYLCLRFKKDKLFLIGGSWGSELGTYLCHAYPEHVAAFVGFGQVVDGARNEAVSYRFALEEAKKAGDAKSVRKLERLGPPAGGIYKDGYTGMMIQRNIMMKYGGYSKSKKKRGYFGSFVVPVLLSGEYSPRDLWGLVRGYRRVLRVMMPEYAATDFPAHCTRFTVPFYIFDGRLDYNTPAELVEDWFGMIEAPEKLLVWFENSGHNPMGDEPEAFKKLLCEKLLAVKEREDCRV
ncbi:MAG TPA: alpha/beta hydrolase [Clostridia bacterium]|nr:alpha/beta hydrolase [Clostridia bacterium]